MLGKLLNATTATFLAIVLLVVAWIGSGMIGREPVTPPERPEIAPPSVAASTSEAREVTTELQLYGDVEPVQIGILRARTEGIVEEVVSQGRAVTVGDQLARLSSDDRVARQTRAQAQVASAQRNYDAAVQLVQRNAGPQANVQTTLAELEAARADLRTVELDIANTRLTAQISGVVSRVISDIGAYVSAGGEVLEVVDNDPLLAVVTVQQGRVSQVREGMPAVVSFIGGERREGRVSFVSPIADAATRTFRVEVQVANPDGNLPSGISADVVIPVETVRAHRISPAFSRLDERGRMGVYIIDGEDRIAFQPMEVVKADAAGIWITGLPERARIVTISHGALAPGQKVEVRETPAEYLNGESSGAEPSQGAGDDPAASGEGGAPLSQDAR